jgi:hypothetical protein
LQASDPDLPSPPSASCSWDDRESEEWIATVEGWTWVRQGRAEGGTWVKSGACPECGHWISVAFDGGLVLPAVEGHDETKVMAFCNCAVDHNGHPASDDPELYRRGCGRWGLVKPPLDWPGRKGVSTGQWRLYWAMHPIRWFDRDMLRAAQPSNWGADPSDRGWEAEALGSRTALTEIRQAAEKWSQSIAAILGVFTIVAFVKGPDSFANIHGAAAVAAASLMGTALVLAGAGIWLGALAAQATPWKQRRLTGWELKKFTTHQAWKAARYLKASRWLVLGAAVLVLAAVSVAWVATIPNDNAKNARAVVRLSPHLPRRAHVPLIRAESASGSPSGAASISIRRVA